MDIAMMEVTKKIKEASQDLSYIEQQKRVMNGKI